MPKQKNYDNQDIKVKTRYLNMMILAIIPFVILIGLIIVPILTKTDPYWNNPTVFPASFFLVVSFFTYYLLNSGKYYWAQHIYIYGFILAPYFAVALYPNMRPELLGLMVGGIIIASVIDGSRLTMTVSISISLIAISLLFFKPTIDVNALIITLCVVANLSALIVIFKIINNNLERVRRAQLDKSNKVIRTQNKELVKTNVELDKFLYSLSHDMRAPLSSIIGLVNLYQTESDKQNKDQYIDHIKISITRAFDYVEEIEDFVLNAKHEPLSENIKIKEFINSVFSQLKYIDITSKPSFQIVTNGIEEIYIDSKRLAIILQNILSNAIKYSKRSDSSFIICELEQDNTDVIFRIKDNGIGVEDHKIEKLFDMFYQGTEISNGSGLGLYIAKEAVDKLGGEISINSSFREGTEVLIRIPGAFAVK